MKEKKKTKQIFFLRCDVYEKGADSSRKQTKKFELLMLGVEWRFYSHYQIFPLKKYCFAPILQIGLRVFFVFGGGFFVLNFRIGLENCTWSVNSDIIQLIFFRGEGVFGFFIFIFIYPAAKKVRKSSFLVSLISMIQNRLRKFELVYSWDFNRTIFQAMFPYFPINPRNLDSKYIIKIQKKSSPNTLVK